MARGATRSSLAAVGGLAGVGLGGGLAWALSRLVVTSASRLVGPIPPRPEASLEFVCSALACALLAWLTVCMAVGIAAAIPGTLGRVARAVHVRITPRALRTAIALALGTSLTAAGGHSALASPRATIAHSASASASSHPSAVSSTPLPDPGGAPHRHHPPATTPEAA